MPTDPTQHPDGPLVTGLDDMWSRAEDTGLDADCSPTKVCRNARDFTFDGIAEEGADLATSWRKLLEREGKAAPGGGSLRDLVLGPAQAD